MTHDIGGNKYVTVHA